ncbi:hypothetical protein SteCoe_33394 [Stentor coeruleus]|uniref:Aspartate aminotransferase n=1 Tax=Stentor coeruleus TaxID=5963 RepID=A0A1R2AX32_9CILI|nr:hypothetical protein SteCoe_33394 [Stentor coeruleus]
MEASNFFAHMKAITPQPVEDLFFRWFQDPSPYKVNLIIGAYRTDEEKPYVFEAVKESERRILSNSNLNKEYIQSSGLDIFNKSSCAILLGKTCPAIIEKRVATFQTLSGSGSLRIGLEFLKTHINPPAVYVSDPSWNNYSLLVNQVGLPLIKYPYWNKLRGELDFDGIINCLQSALEGSVVILQVCAQNPTGVDPTLMQWDRIEQIVKEKKLIPFFDTAYLGWSSGDYEDDAYIVRKFVNNDIQCLISQSFSKCMGLYGERVGALHVVCSNQETAEIVHTNILPIVYTMYLSPPLHGARIVANILSDDELIKQWKNELKFVIQRLKDMRIRLVEELTALNTPGDWSYIVNGIGMFSNLQITPEQCSSLSDKYHCYVLNTGRISICGINTKNIKYVAKSIKAVVEPQKEDILMGLS